MDRTQPCRHSGRGCGTGAHSIDTAQRFPQSRVLAIDISRTSLAYAGRKAHELGLSNIEHAQADILKLDTLGRRFDVIETAGVLHHLADPAAGWRLLLSLLRPNGLMFIGLYSAIARRSLNAVRTQIAARGYRATADDIRLCRQDLIARGGLPPFRDFSSTSGCRDLLFNVMEHQFTIRKSRISWMPTGWRFWDSSSCCPTRLRISGSCFRIPTPCVTWRRGIALKSAIPPRSAICISSGCRRAADSSFRRALHRFDDLGISSAAAEVAGEVMADVILARVRLLFEQLGCHHHEPGRAEAALECAAIDKGLLHIGQSAAGIEILDGRHLFAVDPDTEIEAAGNGLAVDHHGAAAAQALAAAFARAEQVEGAAAVRRGCDAARSWSKPRRR